MTHQGPSRTSKDPHLGETSTSKLKQLKENSESLKIKVLQIAYKGTRMRLSSDISLGSTWC